MHADCLQEGQGRNAIWLPDLSASSSEADQRARFVQFDLESRQPSAKQPTRWLDRDEVAFLSAS